MISRVAILDKIPQLDSTACMLLFLRV